MKLFYNIIVIFSFAASSVIAQVNDFQIWEKISIEKKINKTNNLEIDQSLRLNENATIPYKFLLEAGWNHSFSKTLNTGIFYRYFLDDPTEISKLGHRFFANISLQKRISHWKFIWRIQVQTTYFAVSSENNFDYENVNRHKLTIQYTHKKIPFSPFAEYEFFIPIALFPTIPINENRYGIGLSYKINKHQNFSILYRLFHPLTKKIPEYNYVLGIKWKIEI